EKGISLFKLKIGNDINSDIKKIDEVINNLPNSISLAVDANQTHTIHESKKYVLALEKRNILWFEEPFAPDNIILFEDLVNYCKNNQLNIEIVTGENCPNPQTAIGLFKSGINRFQADPCRMLGFLDNIIMCILCRIFGISIMPHAGGSGLDEMSLHISIFNYMRVVPNENICHSLTENVGFCSHLFSQPTLVKNGVAKTPYMPGYLVGMSESVSQIMKKFEDGITWVKL
ncbi:MAG: enolase C-terminal domain-like protein, partial [SAR202 cluster bacterium]|nr:enolase C-terminal domain-like protein [SAR202 cluster bacterium]